MKHLEILGDDPWVRRSWSAGDPLRSMVLLLHKIKTWLDSHKKSNTCISMAMVLECDDLGVAVILFGPWVPLVHKKNMVRQSIKIKIYLKILGDDPWERRSWSGGDPLRSMVLLLHKIKAWLDSHQKIKYLHIRGDGPWVRWSWNGGDPLRSIGPPST